MNKPATNFYSFHTGIPLEEAGDDQLKGDCIFCKREGHFYVNKDTNQWDCKVCKKVGNIYSFLSAFHAEFCEYGPVAELAKERGVPLSYFRHLEVKYNTRNSTYVIPTYNVAKKLNNLYKVYRNGEGKLNIRGTTGLSSTLFNEHEVTAAEIWLLEGHWDTIAAHAIVGPARDITCIGFPGSGFKAKWANILAGKKVVIFGDNDKAGDGSVNEILKAIEKCPQKPVAVSRIKWPEGLPSKDKGDSSTYDINDLYKDKGSGSYSWIQDHLVPCETTLANIVADNLIVADTSCNTFDKLVQSCETSYHFTHDMRQLLLLLLSSLYSLKIEGEQIWLRIIGPPGSSKTTLARIVGASEQTVLRDTFTGLLSGWKDEQAVDASLISLVANKAFIVKDADALLKQPNVAQIMSELRAFYDKDIAATYRNRINIDAKNIRSVFQLNGTHTLRNIDNTALGDRFLDFELQVTTDDRKKIADSMYKRSYQSAHTGVTPETGVWEHAKGFIDHHLMTWDGVSYLGDEEEQRTKEFCKLISYLRAKVERTRDGKIAYQPHPEVPSRLIGQFTKLYLCAPRIFNAKVPGKEVHQLVARVARDVADVNSPRFKICHALCLSPYQTRDQIVQFTDLSYDTVNRELENMIALDMLTVDKKRLESNVSIHIMALKEDLQSQFNLLSSAE